MTPTERLYRVWNKRKEIGFGKDFDHEVLEKICQEEGVKVATYLTFAERKESESCVQETLDLHVNSGEPKKPFILDEGLFFSDKQE